MAVWLCRACSRRTAYGGTSIGRDGIAPEIDKVFPLSRTQGASPPEQQTDRKDRRRFFVPGNGSAQQGQGGEA
jgi:hypothetical protein